MKVKARNKRKFAFKTNCFAYFIAVDWAFNPNKLKKVPDQIVENCFAYRAPDGFGLKRIYNKKWKGK